MRAVSDVLPAGSVFDHARVIEDPDGAIVPTRHQDLAG